jgi:hypothetical protein
MARSHGRPKQLFPHPQDYIKPHQFNNEKDDLLRNEAADQNLQLRDVCRDLRAISRMRAISCTVIRRFTKSARASETVAAV